MLFDAASIAAGPIYVLWYLLATVMERVLHLRQRQDASIYLCWAGKEFSTMHQMYMSYQSQLKFQSTTRPTNTLSHLSPNTKVNVL